MPPIDDSGARHLAAARASLRRQDFATARQQYQLYLEANREDLEATMELGLAELFDDDDRAFEKTLRTVEREVQAREGQGLTERIRELWCLLLETSKTMGRAAAVATIVAIPFAVGGCTAADEPAVVDESQPPPSTAPDVPPTPPPSPVDAAPQAPPTPVDAGARVDAAPSTGDGGAGRSASDAAVDAVPTAVPTKQPQATPNPVEIRQKFPRRTRYRVAFPRHRLKRDESGRE